jgi:hypothetical protein
VITLSGQVNCFVTGFGCSETGGFHDGAFFLDGSRDVAYS